MRRMAMRLGLAAILVLASAGTALAAAVDKTCPGGASGFQSYDINSDWVPSDGLPAAGVDEWWDLTVAGLAAEGLTPETAAPMFGLTSALELYELVHTGILGLDRYGDGAVCAKPFPEHQNGVPAYIVNAVDNNARAF